MNTQTRLSLLLAAAVTLSASSAMAVNYPYDGYFAHDVKRDRIIAISEDYATLYYYVGPANIDYSSYTGATCPDPTVGWKTGMKYCWGGEDTPAQYLLRMTQGDGAGNRNTGSSSSYDRYCGGADCSGMASNCWTSSRVSTSGFPSISDDIAWEQLRMGDCTNRAGSHIRVFDYFVSNLNTIMFYESTSGGGALWKAVHRSLARDFNYQPIRYNATYEVYAFAEPAITYVRKTGVERVEVRWDGQADTGFRLYHSLDASTWNLIRDTGALTPSMRTCEVSGLLPNTTHYFKMTALNSGGPTIDSAVVAFRTDGDYARARPRVLVVDGADRFREQFSANHTFLSRVGAALAANGLGFDFCANEAVVDQQVDLGEYEAVVWILAEESMFDETFSWAEQLHVMDYLEGGGRLFVSGSEIGWDIDYRAGSTTYKNGHANDAAFYNDYLRADYAGDDAGTYQAAGTVGTIFHGLMVSFDDGTHGTYDVASPDQLSAFSGATVGLTYQGGSGGGACVYHSSATHGTVVNMGFGFETIYPDSSRTGVLRAILGYLNVPTDPPTLVSVRKSAADAVTLEWEGHATQGFRVFQRIDSGSWTQILDEFELGPAARSTIVTGLSEQTRYAFKVQAVNSSGPSGDSDVLCTALDATASTVLIVDGYDRWNAQSGGSNHALVERFAEALTSSSIAYDSCTNETVASDSIAPSAYNAVFWMCGEESTESETFSAAEQGVVEAYLQSGGRLFVSGAEVGWDLVEEANTNNNFSNGSPNDAPFFQNYLKANYVGDDADTYSVSGASGTAFSGLSFSFDDGAHGTYDVSYPDVLGTPAGSTTCLQYGSGPDVSGVGFIGTFPGGTIPGRVLVFGFPFETIYDATNRNAVMAAVVEYLGLNSTGIPDWGRLAIFR